MTTMARSHPDSDPPAAVPDLAAALDRWLAAERAAPPPAPPSASGSSGRAAIPAASGGADPSDPGAPGDPADPANPADSALALLLAALPLAAPRDGFADQVMARVAMAGLHAAPRAVAAPRHRLAWGLGAGLAAGLAGGLALSWNLWLPAVMRLLSPAHLAFLLQATIGAAVGAARALAGAVSLGRFLLLVARAVANPLTTPPVAAMAAVSLLISVLALRFLHALIQRDRRWVYADPI
jgi:hypothetical protein